jgi:hypothetical protein
MSHRNLWDLTKYEEHDMNSNSWSQKIITLSMASNSYTIYIAVFLCMVQYTTVVFIFYNKVNGFKMHPTNCKN